MAFLVTGNRTCPRLRVSANPQVACCHFKNTTPAWGPSSEVCPLSTVHCSCACALSLVFVLVPVLVTCALFRFMCWSLYLSMFLFQSKFLVLVLVFVPVLVFVRVYVLVLSLLCPYFFLVLLCPMYEGIGIKPIPFLVLGNPSLKKTMECGCLLTHRKHIDTFIEFLV